MKSMGKFGPTIMIHHNLTKARPSKQSKWNTANAIWSGDFLYVRFSLLEENRVIPLDERHLKPNFIPSKIGYCQDGSSG